MKIILPVTVTPGTLGVDTILTASNIAETDYSAWNSGTTYAAAARCIKGHKVWESVAGSNLNHDPETDIDNTYWFEVGATNRWRPHDTVVNIQATNANTIELTYAPAEIVNAVALFNLAGTELTVAVTDAIEGLVYSNVMSLQDDSLIIDSYTYCFNDIVYVSDVVLTDLPAYGDAEIDITIDAGSDTAKVGEIILGRQREIGGTLYGTSVGIQNYSTTEVDQFGKRTVTPRSYAKRAEFDIAVRTNQVAGVQKFLADNRDEMLVFVGDEDHPETIVPGYFRDFSIVISNPSFSDCSIEAEGVI